MNNLSNPVRNVLRLVALVLILANLEIQALPAPAAVNLRVTARTAAARVFGYVVVARIVQTNQVQARLHPVIVFQGGRYAAARIWGPEEQVRNLRTRSVLNSVKKFDLYAGGRVYGAFAVQVLEIPPHRCWTELHATGKTTWSRTLDFSRGERDFIGGAEVRLLRLVATSGLSARDFRTLHTYRAAREERQRLIRVAQEHFNRFRREMAQNAIDVTARSAPKLIKVQSFDVERDGALEIVAHVSVPIVPVDIGDFGWAEVYITIIARPDAIARPLAVLSPSNVPSQVQAIDLRGNGSADLLFHSKDHLIYNIYSLQGSRFIQVLEEGNRYYC